MLVFRKTSGTYKIDDPSGALNCRTSFRRNKNDLIFTLSLFHVLGQTLFRVKSGSKVGGLIIDNN